jgi:hypothetical protein
MWTVAVSVLASTNDAVVIQIVRARPSRSKPMSMPISRRKVAARRRRPASARELSGQLCLGGALAR